MTGRRLNSALRVLRKTRHPPARRPDHQRRDGHLLRSQPDPGHQWRQPHRPALEPAGGPAAAGRSARVEAPAESEQGEFKISYFYDPELAPTPEEITSLLLKGEQTVNIIVSFGQFLDILPARASKGAALRWFAVQRDVPLERILAVGGSGADEDMMRGNTLAVVVANRHDEELSELTDIERIFFAESAHAAGILEAIEHYDFFGACQVPES